MKFTRKRAFLKSVRQFLDKADNDLPLEPLRSFLEHYVKNAGQIKIVSSIFVQDHRDLSAQTVERQQFLFKLVARKRVLHFGFADAPFTKDRLASDEILHIKLRKKAASVFGVDIDEDAVKLYREATGDHDNAIADITDPDFKVGKSLSNKFDLVIFGEILEHLKNPGLALQNLRRIALANPKSKVCITVPNAFTFGGFLHALQGYELVHPEHYYYFSPTTLSRLLKDTGFKKIRLKLYTGLDESGKISASESIGLTKGGLIAICEA